MRQRGTIEIKRLFCNECGTPRDIPRHTSRKKVAGHQKNMFCATCKRQTVFTEGE